MRLNFWQSLSLSGLSIVCSQLETLSVLNNKVIFQVEKPFFIFKHHYFFNASMYGLETPTWINVIRDPLTWFESNFYFKRFGWERQPGSRRREDQDLTIDECVTTGSGFLLNYKCNQIVLDVSLNLYSRFLFFEQKLLCQKEKLLIPSRRNRL